MEARDLGQLLLALQERGYRVIGPTLKDHAIVYDEIRAIEDLPIGYGDEQEKGLYRVVKRGDAALFGYNLGPQGWRRFLFRPRERIFHATREGRAFSVAEEIEETGKTAFLGVRACEIQAIEVQDRVFMKGRFQDEPYRRRRENVLIVAVQCTTSARTCFCVSMKTGPRVEWGYDLVLTEVLSEQEHYFLCEAGSEEGARVLERVSRSAATEGEAKEANARVLRAAEKQVRSIPRGEFPGLLMRNFEHPRWDEVATRCLSCTNCTIVCPTCFCSTHEDTTNLEGTSSERWRRWDSCFNLEHSYIHGGNIRATVRSRYRQWLTHKLDTWIEQYGVSGCVGCGRCIAWCPVGIDITEETNAIRATPGERRNEDEDKKYA